VWAGGVRAGCLLIIAELHGTEERAAYSFSCMDGCMQRGSERAHRCGLVTQRETALISGLRRAGERASERTAQPLHRLGRGSSIRALTPSHNVHRAPAAKRLGYALSGCAAHSNFNLFISPITAMNT
jgi:hypothetical protein